MSTPERHPATEEVWQWLEQGPGSKRPEVDRTRIAAIVAQLDVDLWALDRSIPWPEPAPLPSDYGDTAE